MHGQQCCASVCGPETRLLLGLVTMCLGGNTDVRHCFAAVVLAAAIAIAGTIQQDDLADAIYGDGVSSGAAHIPFLTQLRWLSACLVEHLSP